jgi:hypothetical protein
MIERKEAKKGEAAKRQRRAVHYRPDERTSRLWGKLGHVPHRAAARQDRVAKNLFLLSNTQTKGSNSLVLLQYTKTDTTAKSLTTSRHYEVDTSGLLGMQRHCMSSQTFD